MDASLTTRSSPSTASTGPSTSNLTVSRRETDASSLTPARVGRVNLAEPFAAPAFPSSTVAGMSAVQPMGMLMSFASGVDGDIAGGGNKRPAAAMSSAASGHARTAKKRQTTSPASTSSHQNTGGSMPAASSSSSPMSVTLPPPMSSKTWRLTLLMYPLAVSA